MLKQIAESHLYSVVENVDCWMVVHYGKDIEPFSSECAAWEYVRTIVESLV
jgi:hypothetical protein